MFPNNIISTFGTRNALTLPKVLSGISKTLGIVNQAIPIYQQAKPMIQKGRTMLKLASEISKPDKANNTYSNIKSPDKVQKTVNKEQKQITNNPVFFL